MSELKDFDANIIGQDLKKRYEFTCPSCQHIQSAEPSIFMQMGVNMGGGSCMNCKAHLILSIDSKNEKMIAEQHPYATNTQA